MGSIGVPRDASGAGPGWEAARAPRLGPGPPAACPLTPAPGRPALGRVDDAPDMEAEVALRRRLVQVALGRAPADRVLRVERMLDVHTRRWLGPQDIVMAEGRIAWTGPAGGWRGAGPVAERPGLAAVPGFGEAHKHIESSGITPDHEAELVLPHGCTWTCEASHELSNVCGPGNLEFWLTPRRLGSPYKIFPLPGSATPPTAHEETGGRYGAAEQAAFMRHPMVPGLDEVMDWPAVADPDNPSGPRLWGMIGATMAARGVVEGHGAGLRALPQINAFAAAGLSSDHEGWTGPEVLDKLRRGVFAELRPHTLPEILAHLIEAGVEDWSQVALVTDDRSAAETLGIGATDHNVRLAIRSGLAPEVAIQAVTLNPARHMRLTPWVGSLAPGRHADVVLLRDVAAVDIAEVWADGVPVAREGAHVGPQVRVDWPGCATRTVRTGRTLAASDFAVPAPPGRTSVEAALLRPFHWEDAFLTGTLPVSDGLVRRGPGVTKLAMVDRHSGSGGVAAMFWRGCGPATPGTALGATVAHDSHDIWVVGSCDAAMALVANRLARMQGGWVLASGGRVLAEARLEVAGLMTARPARAHAAEMAALDVAIAGLDWHWEPSSSPRWTPGDPRRLAYATLTCAPWRWVLVAPGARVPGGLVDVRTGERHPVVW